MEVEVWKSRRDGLKLPHDALDRPHRGWLRLARYNIAGEITLHADLRLGACQGAPAALLCLTSVEVRRMDERGALHFWPTGLACGPGQRQCAAGRHGFRGRCAPICEATWAAHNDGGRREIYLRNCPA